MLKDNIILKEGASGAFTYVLTGQQLSESKRNRTDANPGTPKTLVVKHSTTGSKADIVDRHLVQISDTVKDSVGVLRTAVVNLTIAVPRDGFTNAAVRGMVDRLVSLLTTVPANLDVSASVSALTTQVAMIDAILIGEN